MFLVDDELVLAGENKKITVYDFQTNAIVSQITSNQPGASIRTITSSPQGGFYLIRYFDASIEIWSRN